MKGTFGSNQNRGCREDFSHKKPQQNISVQRSIAKNNKIKALIVVGVGGVLVAVILNFFRIMDFWYYNIVAPLISFLVPITLVAVVVGIIFLLIKLRLERNRYYRR